MVPSSLACGDALFFRRDDVERHHRQHGAVHRHRHARPVERDAVEERAHVVDRIDRDAGHADIAGDARMVGIVAAMRRQVEGDREALLPGGEVAPVEGVRILRRREAGILPDRPGPPDIHRRVGAADKGRQARPAIDEIDALAIGRGRNAVSAGCLPASEYPRAALCRRLPRRASAIRFSRNPESRPLSSVARVAGADEPPRRAPSLIAARPATARCSESPDRSSCPRRTRP